MKFIVAPDSFKGCLSALEVARFIEKGIKNADPNIDVKKIPVADGGEGTVAALVAATGGKVVNHRVKGPLAQSIDSFFGVLGNGQTAVIEMAAAAGLNHVPEDKKNPLYTTTYGVGQLIKAALDLDCQTIIVGIGGSATNDGGMGMAQALGAVFYDKNGSQLGLGGIQLKDIDQIDVSQLDERLKSKNIIVACDVNNPLCGPEGASRIYGPQKGATEEMIDLLDRGLQNYAHKINNILSIDIAPIPGSGAAGGLGGGLIAFTGARLKPGIDIVLEYCEFEKWIKDACLLITGEGRTDHQTIFGKVPVGVAALAVQYDVPVVCLSGGLGEGYQAIYQHGIDAAFSNFNEAITLKEAMQNAGKILTERAYAITRLVTRFKK